MQVSVEKTSELSRKMTVSVPEAIVQEKMAARLKSLAREVKVDGFRPGKVPPHVVKKMFGAQVRSEIAGDLIQTTYYEALQNQDLKPASQPYIDALEEAEGFKYTAVFEIYPDISLENIDQLEVVRPMVVVEEADVDNMIEKLRLQKREWVAVERAAQENDRVTINFSGQCDGENFTDGTVENYSVDIGAKQMITGFEDNLVGLEIDAVKTFELTFPEKYGNEKLAGKVGEFEVTVTKIEAPVMPQIDAEFIKGYGIEEGTVDSFRNDVKNNMERKLVQALRGKLKDAVMNALYEKVQFAVPSSLIDEEIENLMKPYLETAKRQKIKLEDLHITRDLFEEQAKRRIALGLILSEIIQKNEIKLDNGKVRAMVEDMAKSYERPEDVVNWYFADKSRLNDVQQMVLEEQTVDWLLAQAKVSEETLSFSDVMDKQQS